MFKKLFFLLFFFFSSPSLPFSLSRSLRGGDDEQLGMAAFPLLSAGAPFMSRAESVSGLPSYFSFFLSSLLD